MGSRFAALSVSDRGILRSGLHCARLCMNLWKNSE